MSQVNASREACRNDRFYMILDNFIIDKIVDRSEPTIDRSQVG